MTAVLDTVTTEPAVTEADGGRRPPWLFRRLVRGGLGVHLAALVLLLACATPFVRPGPAFTTDEGAYGLQQRVLRDTGGFAFAWPGAPIDPAGRWYPIMNGAAGTRGTMPYAAHPAYPLLLARLADLVGETAALVGLSLAGALAAAVAAWLLAAEVDDRLSPAAFWLAALGPLLANGWIGWAHTLGAALAGASLVAALRAARRGVLSPAFGLAVAATAAGCLLRSENVIFGAATAAAFGWAAARRSGWWRAVPGSVVLAATGVATAVVEARWTASIVGTTSAVKGLRQDSGSFLAGRLGGAYHSLLLPRAGPTGDVLFAGVAVAAVGLAVMARRAAARRGAGDPAPGSGLLAVGCAGLAAAGVVTMVVAAAPSRPVTGLLAAWPVLLITVPFVRVRRPRLAPVAIAAGLLVAGVAATQYPEGGGLEWGGRFFSPAFVPLAVLAAVGARELVAAAAQVSVGVRRFVLGAVVAAAVVPAAAGAVVLRARHLEVAGISRDVLHEHPAVVVTSSPALPRSEWRSQQRVTWFVVEPEDVAEALAVLRRAGVAEAELVEPALPEGALAAATSVSPVDAPTIERITGRALTVVNVKLR